MSKLMCSFAADIIQQLSEEGFKHPVSGRDNLLNNSIFKSDQAMNVQTGAF